MQRCLILEHVQAVLRDLIGDRTIAIADHTTVDDIPDWDSALHVQLIVAIEKHFSVLFSPEEYMEFVDIGEIIDCVAAKLDHRGGLSPLDLADS